MGVVSTKDVQQVAFLARLQLHDTELAKFAAQLDDILQYVQQLQAVPTESVGPTSHVLPLSNIMRPDTIRPSVPSEEILAIAPARHGQLVKVPKVIET